MPFKNRALSLRPVHSEKQEITWSNLAQNASTVQQIDIVSATEAPSAADEITIGATVKWIYFEFHFSAETLTSPKVIHWIVQKVPSGVAQMESVPSVYDTTVKKFIFKRGMEMLPSDAGTVFKRILVVRIPPRYSRFGDGDQIQFRYICSSSETINACGIAIYKQFS